MILFSDALTIGSMIYPHGRGGIHRTADDPSKCAVEAALSVAGLPDTVFHPKVFGGIYPLYMWDREGALRAWPYLRRVVWFGGRWRMLMSIIVDLNDKGCPRGECVALVRHCEEHWGLRPRKEATDEVSSRIERDGSSIADDSNWMQQSAATGGRTAVERTDLQNVGV